MVAALRAEGGDLPSVEVKAAAGGLPDSIVPTLCAFANRPGGGTVILGLDEAAGFMPVVLADRRRLKASLASKARQSLEPPVLVEIDEGVVDGEAVVVAVVPELAPSQKPCRVIGGAHRGVWVRAWDGDYRASDVEVQGLLAARGQPRFDSEPAPGATQGDLDPELVDEFIGACRSGSEQLGRIRERDELLWRMGVLVGDDRVPSIAGILALGTYPQQHLPAVGLQAILAGATGGTDRARDARRFDGPIPRIIADAVAWVARSSPTAIRAQPAGAVVDAPMWPPEAVRELVGNALIHRDLSPWALGETGLLRLDSDRLVVRNPGGLYGLTIDRLGQIGVTSARNANLVRICQYVRLPDGTRAVEALASGIPTVLEALTSAALPPPVFDDDGLRFTAVLRQSRAAVPKVAAGSSGAVVLAALVAGPLDVDQLAQSTGLSPANIRKRLRELRAQGLVVQRGGRGRPTIYERVGG
ncbi:MAG TPA: ATP-binding protein [Ilumatobacter sp.]|nr:ATP-binding protein [Ilumatobacter sp.]